MIPRVDTLRMTIRRGDSVSMGPMEITRIQAASHTRHPAYLITTVNLDPNTGAVLARDSTMLDAANLGAIWHHSHSRMELLLSFDDTSVTGSTRMDGGSPGTVSMAVTVRPFYYGTIGYVLANLAVAPGFGAVLPVQEGTARRLATVEVTGLETLSSRTELVRCWRIQVRLAGGTPQTYWLAVDDRRVISRSFMVSPTTEIRYSRE
jgi:hypothetical protein